MKGERSARGGIPHCAKRLLVLAGAHVWLALNLTATMNLLGVIYLVFPPLALYAFGNRVERFATFALAIAVVWLLLCGVLGWAFRRRLPVLRLSAWLLLAPVPLAWLPLASGELVRATAMRVALLQAGADCHATARLLASVHDSGRGRSPHAWMMVDGVRYIWSYDQMRFVRDKRSAAGSCPPTQPRRA